jgi:hypothetical protein
MYLTQVIYQFIQLTRVCRSVVVGKECLSTLN